MCYLVDYITHDDQLFTHLYFFKYCFRLLVPLSKHMWNTDIPLIVAKSYGFIGSVRVQVREHTVIETHPDNMTPDLRLDTPFPGLKQYMDRIKLQDLDLKDHVHVPYLVPLYKCLIQWREGNSSRLPTTYKEKESLRNAIRKGILCLFTFVVNIVVEYIMH